MLKSREALAFNITITSTSCTSLTYRLTGLLNESAAIPTDGQVILGSKSWTIVEIVVVHLNLNCALIRLYSELHRDTIKSFADFRSQWNKYLLFQQYYKLWQGDSQWNQQHSCRQSYKTSKGELPFWIEQVCALSIVFARISIGPTVCNKRRRGFYRIGRSQLDLQAERIEFINQRDFFYIADLRSRFYSRCHLDGLCNADGLCWGGRLYHFCSVYCLSHGCYSS